MTATSDATDVLGGPVAWRSSGDSDAPVAVFFHGLGGNRTSWEPQLAALADVRRCCAWELPGYGDSPGLVESLPQAAALAAEWIAQLSESPVDVVGLSFGGMVAQHLALDHPQVVRTLALLDTSPAFGMDGTTTAEEWLATRVTPLHQEASPERFGPIVDAMVGPDCSAEVKASIVSTMRAVPGESLAAACRALVRHDTRERLHDITARTLVLVGAQDTETPPSYARTIADRIEGSRYVEVPGCGHISNLEEPDVVNEQLRALWHDGPRAAA